MTTDSTPTEQGAAGTPDLPPQQEGAKRKRPVAWMILAGLGIAAAIGLGVWALLLNDDLNDTEEQLEAQTVAAESASAEAESRIAEARVRIEAALSDIAGVVVVSDEDVAGAEQAAAEAEQSVAEAQAAVDQAQGEARAGECRTRTGPSRGGTSACGSGASRALRGRFARSDAGAGRERRRGRGLRGGCVERRDGRERLLMN